MRLALLRNRYYGTLNISALIFLVLTAFFYHDTTSTSTAVLVFLSGPVVLFVGDMALSLVLVTIEKYILKKSESLSGKSNGSDTR